MFKNYKKTIISTVLLASVFATTISCQKQVEPIEIPEDKEEKIERIKYERINLIKKLYDSYADISGYGEFDEFDKKLKILDNFKNLYFEVSKDYKDTKLWNQIGIAHYNPFNKYQNHFFKNINLLLEESSKIYDKFKKNENDTSSLKKIILKWDNFWKKYKYYKATSYSIMSSAMQKEAFYNSFDTATSTLKYLNTPKVLTNLTDYKTHNVKYEQKTIDEIIELLNKQKYYITNDAVNQLIKILWEKPYLIKKFNSNEYETKEINLSEVMIFPDSIGVWNEGNAVLHLNIGIKDENGNIIDYNNKTLLFDSKKFAFTKPTNPSKIMRYQLFNEHSPKSAYVLKYGFLYFVDADDIFVGKEINSLSNMQFLVKEEKENKEHTKFINDQIVEYIKNMSMLSFNPLEVWENNLNLNIKKGLTYDRRMSPLFEGYIGRFFGYLGGYIFKETFSSSNSKLENGFNKTKELNIKNVYTNIKKALFKTISENFSTTSFKLSEYSDPTYYLHPYANYILLGRNSDNQNNVLGGENLIKWVLSKYAQHSNYLQITKAFENSKNIAKELLFNVGNNHFTELFKKVNLNNISKTTISETLNAIKSMWIEYVSAPERNKLIQKDLQNVLNTEQIIELKKQIVEALLAPYYSLQNIFNLRENTYNWPIHYKRLLEAGFIYWYNHSKGIKTYKRLYN